MGKQSQKLIIEIEHKGDLCPNYQALMDDFIECFGDIECQQCGIVFEYAKNFKYSPDNPYINIEWVSTIMIEKDA